MDLNNVKFTWLEDSPKHWGQKKVKHLFKYSKEKIETPEDYPILSLTMRGVKERDVSSNEGQLPDTFNGYSLLKKNQLVFNPMDLISGWVDSTHIEGIISPSYRIIEPLSNDIIIGYYRYYFQKLYKEKVLFPFGEGVHYQYRWGLGSVTLMNFPLLYPSKKEQQQIVTFLDDKTQKIDSLIQQKEKKIELLKEKRTSLINHVVTKGLDSNVEMKDSGVEWIGEIPSHWFCVGTNKVYNDLGTGTTPTSDNTEYYSDNGYHWITTTDLNEGIMYDTLSKITEKSVEDYPNLRLYPSGSIYISMYGGRIGKLGVSTFDSYCNQSVCVLPKNDEIIVKFYYYWFLGFQEFVKGMGRGGGQPNINKEMIKSFPTVKIPLTEQQQIVEYLDEQTQLIDKTVSIEEKRIELLKEYRQSLISEVVTGKRKVV